MARTQIGSGQVLDGTIKREDLDVSTPGSAVVRKLIAGTNISFTSTGTDSGTGDVTINATGGGGGGGVTNVIDVDIDFGGPIDNNLCVTTVAAPWAASTSIIIATPSMTSNTDHDAEDAILEGLKVYVTNIDPGVGFDLIAHSENGTWGIYNILCTEVYS